MNIRRFNEGLDDASEVEGLKTYLNQSDPNSFTYEFLETRNLIQLYTHAIYYNLHKVEYINRRHDGRLSGISNNTPDNPLLVNGLKLFFEESSEFIEKEKEFFENIGR